MDTNLNITNKFEGNTLQNFLKKFEILNRISNIIKDEEILSIQIGIFDMINGGPYDCVVETANKDYEMEESDLFHDVDSYIQFFNDEIFEYIDKNIYDLISKEDLKRIQDIYDDSDFESADIDNMHIQTSLGPIKCTNINIWMIPT